MHIHIVHITVNEKVSLPHEECLVDMQPDILSTFTAARSFTCQTSSPIYEHYTHICLIYRCYIVKSQSDIAVEYSIRYHSWEIYGF